LKDSFFGIVYLAALVAALFIPVTVAGWLYRRALRRRIDGGEEPPIEPLPPAVPAPRGTATAEEARADALGVTRRVRRAQLAAWLAYAAVTRYPMNAVYCYRSTWRRAFARLADGAVAVLMDLRGFTEEHKGCEVELRYLFRNFDLDRIVLLTDGRTDKTEIERIKRETGVERELEIGEKPLFDRLLRAALT